MIARRGGCSNVGGHGRGDGPWWGYCGCLLPVGVQWYHPQAGTRAFAPTHNRAASMCDGAPYFCEDDVGKACHGWEAWQVQRSGVRGAYLITVGQACNDRFLGRLDVGDMRTSGEKRRSLK
jgi:hypothetical protein